MPRNFEIEPTNMLKYGLYISSIMILIIGAMSVYLNPETDFIAACTCFAIPFSSFYINKKRITLIFSYVIIDLHWFFWLFLCISIVMSQAPGFFIAPFIALAYFSIIVVKRKSNFRVVTWRQSQMQVS